mmetsp:Transcript_10316/g.23584  ORF Transcript_10316/g.23584 Transcript_10316/m.23584 type:complete len:179 (+) Transcript_10316:896-1432(+)
MVKRDLLDPLAKLACRAPRDLQELQEYREQEGPWERLQGTDLPERRERLGQEEQQGLRARGVQPGPTGLLEPQDSMGLQEPLAQTAHRALQVLLEPTPTLLRTFHTPLGETEKDLRRRQGDEGGESGSGESPCGDTISNCDSYVFLCEVQLVSTSSSLVRRQVREKCRASQQKFRKTR